MNVKMVVALVAAIIVIAAAAVYVVKIQEENEEKFSGIIYDGNGGKTEDGKTVVKVADTDKVEDMDFQRDGYTFAYWYHLDGDEEIVYQTGDKVPSTSGGYTLYASWVEIPADSE